LARTDRVDIRNFIGQANPTAAMKLDQVIGERTTRLVEQPFAGRPGRLQGTRELVIHGNYIVVYDLVQDVVRILRILHVARRWP
jgi:toxin ParE1/3/4